MQQLAQMAEQKGVYLLAVTDHDQTDHFAEVAAYTGHVALVMGTELTCTSALHPGFFHLLVYFDKSSLATNEFRRFKQKLDAMRETRRLRMR